MSRWYWRDGTLACGGMDGNPDWHEQIAAIDKKLRDPDYKILKQETLPNGKRVSTVWIGLDHSFNDWTPLIFETMVFGSEHSFNELDMRRYTTEAEALAGHEQMKAEWSSK